MSLHFYKVKVLIINEESWLFGTLTLHLSIPQRCTEVENARPVWVASGSGRVAMMFLRSLLARPAAGAAVAAAWAPQQQRLETGAPDKLAPNLPKWSVAPFFNGGTQWDNLWSKDIVVVDQSSQKVKFYINFRSQYHKTTLDQGAAILVS